MSRSFRGIFTSLAWGLPTVALSAGLTVSPTAINPTIVIGGHTLHRQPVIDSLDLTIVDPAGGGQLITFTGSGFTGATDVKFDTTSGTSITVVNDTTITVRPPAHAVGLVDVSVTGPGGTGVLVDAVEYWDPTQSEAVGLHLDASKGVSAGGSFVWTDQVTGTRTYSTSTYNPAVQTDAFGASTGVDAVRFDPTGYDQLEVTSGAFNYSSSQKHHQILLVGKWTSTDNTATYVQANPLSGASQGGGAWNTIGATAGSAQAVAYDFSGATIATLTGTSTGLNNDAAHLLQHHTKRTTTNSQDGNLAVNGAWEAGIGVEGGATSNKQQYLYGIAAIGMAYGGVDTWQRDLGAVIGLDKEPSYLDQWLIEQWAAQRFGVVLSTSTDAAALWRWTALWRGYSGSTPWASARITGRTLTGTAPSTGTAVDGHSPASFNGTSNVLTANDTTDILIDCQNYEGFAGHALVKVGAWKTNYLGASAYANGGSFALGGGYGVGGGLTGGNGGNAHATVWNTGGAFINALMAMSLGEWAFLHWRTVGSQLEFGVNGVWGKEVHGIQNIAASQSVYKAADYTGGSGYQQYEELESGLINEVPSKEEFGKLLDRLKLRYPSIASQIDSREDETFNFSSGVSNTLALDLNADVGISLSGSDVIAWNDQSGAGDSGRNFVPSDTSGSYDATKAPQYTASNPLFNGHASVDFSAVDDRLTSGTWSATKTAPMTIFVVYHGVCDGSSNYILSEWTDQIYIPQNTAGGCTVAGPLGGVVSAIVPVSNKPYIFGVQCRAAGTTSKLMFNQHESDGAVNIGTTSISRLTVGNYKSIDNYSLEGSIARVLVYEGEMTASDVHRVFTALAKLYGNPEMSQHDPEVRKWRAWYRADHDGTNPWKGSRSKGYSFFKSLTNGGTAIPTYGTVVNNFYPASFVAASGHAFTDATYYLDSYLGDGSAWSVSVKVKFSSPSAPTAQFYDNPHILGESVGRFGLVYSTSGVALYATDSGTTHGTAWAACSAGAWHTIDGKYDGNKLYVRVDGGAWFESSAGVGTIFSISTLVPRIGRNYGSVYANMDLLEARYIDRVLTDAEFDEDELYSYRRYRT